MQILTEGGLKIVLIGSTVLFFLKEKRSENGILVSSQFKLFCLLYQIFTVQILTEVNLKIFLNGSSVGT